MHSIELCSSEETQVSHLVCPTKASQRRMRRWLNKTKNCFRAVFRGKWDCRAVKRGHFVMGIVKPAKHHSGFKASPELHYIGLQHLPRDPAGEEVSSWHQRMPIRTDTRKDKINQPRNANLFLQPSFQLLEGPFLRAAFHRPRSKNKSTHPALRDGRPRSASLERTATRPSAADRGHDSSARGTAKYGAHLVPQNILSGFGAQHVHVAAGSGTVRRLDLMRDGRAPPSTGLFDCVTVSLAHPTVNWMDS